MHSEDFFPFKAVDSCVQSSEDLGLTMENLLDSRLFFIGAEEDCGVNVQLVIPIIFSVGLFEAIDCGIWK